MLNIHYIRLNRRRDFKYHSLRYASFMIFKIASIIHHELYFLRSTGSLWAGFPLSVSYRYSYLRYCSTTFLWIISGFYSIFTLEITLAMRTPPVIIIMLHYVVAIAELGMAHSLISTTDILWLPAGLLTHRRFQQHYDEGMGYSGPGAYGVKGTGIFYSEKSTEDGNAY